MSKLDSVVYNDVTLTQLSVGDAAAIGKDAGMRVVLHGETIGFVGRRLQLGNLFKVVWAMNTEGKPQGSLHLSFWSAAKQLVKRTTADSVVAEEVNA